MPWEEVSTMNSKVNFISDFENERYTTFTDLCYRYGISTKTGYKYIKRYQDEGIDGLKEKSRKPHHCPHKTSEKIEQALVELRKKKPSRGAKKIKRPFKKLHPTWTLPTDTTINNIFSRNGLVTVKHKRTKLMHPGRPISIATAPNQVLGADYKGEFKMLNGRYCYPLTISDLYSRYILCCTGLYSPNLEDTMKQFNNTFRKYGLPERIRTDNGTPFAASNSLGRLSKLSAWLIRLGVFPELTEPASPQQNGIHERMHKTLKAEILRNPCCDLKRQQRMFDEFVDDFNNDRPHEALGQELPATLYRFSPREMPKKLPPVEYPKHFEVRRVSRNGGIRWKNEWVNASHVLAEEYIGFEEFDNELYHVYFSFVQIGRFDERTGIIETDRSNTKFDFNF